MRIISKRVLEVIEEICICYIDWQNSFRSFDWTKLVEMHTNIGVKLQGNIDIYCNLYKGQRVKLHLNKG
jgi:hypothetical protein